MLKTNFSRNHGGKLLADQFTTVRLHDGKYVIGQWREIYLRDQLIGTGMVMSLVQFELKDLPDMIAFMDCGNDAQYLKTLLYRYYQNVHEQSRFDVVVIKWETRHLQPTRDLFTEYWNKLVENAPHEQQLAFNY